ncbi:MAG: phage tail protein [Oscillospiraceae bacterium]|nr:phage tail protein [Oscillospiraceae bacterium]
MFGRSDTSDYVGFIQANNFYVSFGTDIIAFSRISNLETTAEYDIIQEGGLNDRVHIVYKGNTQVGTATFEKAVHKNDLSDYDKIVQVGNSFDTVNVFVTNGTVPQKLYVLTDCFITKKSLSGFDASSSELLISRMDLVYSNMDVVPV